MDHKKISMQNLAKIELLTGGKSYSKNWSLSSLIHRMMNTGVSIAGVVIVIVVVVVTKKPCPK